LKKISIFIVSILSFIALLPLVGNSLSETLLDSKIENLKAKGLLLVDSKSDSSYLRTKRHYEFKVQSASTLSDFKDEAVMEFLRDMVVGVDVEYSNIPMMKDINIDIYPLSLSKKSRELLKTKDSNLYDYAEQFLKKQGLLYHLTYNLVSKNFSGYLKNIDESYISNGEKRASLRVVDFNYKGSGDFRLQSLLDYTLSHLLFEYKIDKELVMFEARELKSHLESPTEGTYSTTKSAKKLFMRVKTTHETLYLDAKEMVVDISLEKGIKESLYLKVASKELNSTQDSMSYSLENLNAEIVVEGLDSEILQKLKASSKESKKSLMMALLSKGMTLKILELKSKNISLNGGQKLGSMSLKSALRVKKDSAFAMKANLMPLLLLQDIDLELRMKLSDKIFLKAMEHYPMLSFIKSYSKDVGSSILYDVSFVDGELELNGKKVY